MRTTYESNGLTRHQDRVMQLILLGFNNREIAERLGLSNRGVQFHVSNLLEKFDSVNRTELAVRFVRQQEQGQ